MIFPRVLVFEWGARRGWITGGRLVAACVDLEVMVKVCRIWMNMVEDHGYSTYRKILIKGFWDKLKYLG